MAVKVFVSHASQDRTIAEEASLALRGAGFEVFFDQSDLPPGGDYHARIRNFIAQSDYLVFLISPDSIAAGRYTLSELKQAEEKWPHPRERVLPVMVRPTPHAEIPPYLRAVTILSPRGSTSAEVASALQALVNPSTESTEVPEGYLLEAASNALQAIHDLDNAIRAVLGPLSRFDHTWPDIKRQEIISSVESLADAERILSRVRQDLAQLAEIASRVLVPSAIEEETVAEVIACGSDALASLGESEVTPWPGPHELFVLLNSIRAATTSDAAVSVREQAARVQSVVNRDLLRKADGLIGRWRGSMRDRA